MAHTPGKWRKEILPNGQMTILTDDTHLESQCLSVVWIPTLKNGVSAFSERDANARLIAAAPELLAACKELLSHMWDDRKRNVKKNYSLMVAEVAAQNAIRKAEGRD